MARPSPSTRRVLALLDLLAANPGRAFSLTHLIHALKMNRATCHGLVHELVDAGYLYRTRDKLYVLGPAASRLGRAADLHSTPLAVALSEMKELANRHDAVCAAVFRDGADVVMREQASSVSHLNWLGRLGTRWPLRPPFGSIFLAWSTERQIDNWFAALDPPLTDEERQRMEDGMAFARANKFQFVVQRLPQDMPEEDIDWIFAPDPAQRPLDIETALDPAQAYWMTSMSSPVFDEQGRVAFVLSLRGFSGWRQGETIAALGEELRAACDRIASFSAV